MISINAKLVIDIGNSETRVRVKFPVGESRREVKIELSNYFADINKEYKVPADYNEKDSTIFSLNNFKLDDAILSGTYVNGALCEGEFRKVRMRPSALEKKYNILSTALSFSLAVLKGTQAIAQELNIIDLNTLDITWGVVVLLPPEDLDKGKIKIEELFRSIQRVDYIMPSVSLDVKIGSVTVFPEGFCAYVCSIFKPGMTVRSEMLRWLDRTVLVLDIGAGTMDKLLISKTKVVDNSRKSDTIGGNQVLSGVKRSLRKNLDLVVTEEEVQNGILTGVVMDGIVDVDISDIVSEEKMKVVQTEMSNLNDYFEDMQFPTRSIGGILICGGGSIPSKVAKIPSIGEELFKFLKTLAPNSELVPVPVDDKGVALSPRELNIEGASILADMN